MQIQSPSFTYQNPLFYGNQSFQSQQPPASTMQGFYGPQSQSDQAMNILACVLMRVLDFAFNLISQLHGQSQKSGPGFKSALTSSDGEATSASTPTPNTDSPSIWDMGKDLLDSVTSSLGINKLFGTVIDGAKSVFSGSLFKTAAKVGGAIASIF